MCGGCNVLAEGAGVSLIMARYWWVARRGRMAVAEAETILERVPSGDRSDDFVDPMLEVTRIV